MTKATPSEEKTAVEKAIEKAQRHPVYWLINGIFVIVSVIAATLGWFEIVIVALMVYSFVSLKWAYNKTEEILIGSFSTEFLLELLAQKPKFDFGKIDDKKYHQMRGEYFEIDSTLTLLNSFMSAIPPAFLTLAGTIIITWSFSRDPMLLALLTAFLVLVSIAGFAFAKIFAGYKLKRHYLELVLENYEQQVIKEKVRFQQLDPIKEFCELITRDAITKALTQERAKEREGKTKEQEGQRTDAL